MSNEYKSFYPVYNPSTAVIEFYAINTDNAVVFWDQSVRAWSVYTDPLFKSCVEKAA